MENKAGIYSITINNKTYVGSSTNVKRRLIQHKSDLNNNRHVNIYLQRAYNKYNEFNTSILEYCVDVSADELKNRELYFIKQLKSEYNIQDPVTNFNTKPIYQFNFNRELITRYDNVTIAANALGISESNISHAAQENEKDTKSAGGYYWSYTSTLRLIRDDRHKEIHVYNTEGFYLTTYSNIKECAIALFPTRTVETCRNMINRITKYKTATLEGYRFSYIKLDKLDNSKLLNILHNYPIVQMSYDNTIQIKVWENMKSAATSLNCKTGLICCAILDKERSQGFYWKRLGI